MVINNTASVRSWNFGHVYDLSPAVVAIRNRMTDRPHWERRGCWTRTHFEHILMYVWQLRSTIQARLIGRSINQHLNAVLIIRKLPEQEDTKPLRVEPANWRGAAHAPNRWCQAAPGCCESYKDAKTQCVI